MTQGKKKSTFITQDSVPDDHFIDTFGAGVNRKIPKAKFFKQIRDEAQTFIYENVVDLQAANLEADPDDPVYVRVAETGFWLYQITSLAATAADIVMDNGTTATRIYEETAVIPLPDITSLSSLNTAALVDGQQFSRASWRPGSEYGYARLKWNAALDRSNHDGINVFAPNVTPPTDFSDRQQRRDYRNANPTGTGCFVLLRRSGQPVTLLDAGAEPGEDATYELQDLLATGKLNCESGEGEFLVDQVSTLSVMGQYFRTSKGGSLRATAADITVLQVDADGCTVEADIDCADLGRIGVEVLSPRAGYRVADCKIKNVRSETVQAFGIVSRSGSGGYIEDNEIRSVFSAGNGSSGDGPGLSRAIQYVPALTPTGDTHIRRNYMYDITGEEGDVISVQITPSDWGGNYPYPDSRCFVKNNYGENWTRRFVKNQGSRTVISYNECHQKAAPAPGLVALFAISLIACDNCDVSSNDIDCGGVYFGYNTDGSNVYTNRGNRFTDNHVRNTGDGRSAVSIRQSENCHIEGGSITNGPSDFNWIGIGTTTNSSVTDVKFYGDTATTGELIVSTTDSSNIHISDNESYCVSAGRFIQAPAANSVITGNVSMGTTFSAGVISGDDPTSAGSVVRFNTALTPGSSMLVNFGAVDIKDLGNIAT